MLSNTFTIFPGIGERTERHIWNSGVFTWRDFLDRKRIPGFSPARKDTLDLHVREAEAMLEAGDFPGLGALLAPGEAWRMWDLLASEALCFDIETDGNPSSSGMVTVAGFYSCGEYRAYIDGHGLNGSALREEFSGARLLVSYFGGGFDLPYLRACYTGLEREIPHFDLCPAGHRVGLKGGLKSVEKQLGIHRPSEVEGMSGYEAVLLWRAHKAGDTRALETLVGYNREDTVNLHTLAWIIYEKLRGATGLPAIMAARLPADKGERPRV